MCTQSQAEAWALETINFKKGGQVAYFADHALSRWVVLNGNLAVMSSREQLLSKEFKLKTSLHGAPKLRACTKRVDFKPQITPFDDILKPWQCQFPFNWKNCRNLAILSS
eukprot:221625-Pelagomonas_calceolata.AAC.3